MDGMITLLASSTAKDRHGVEKEAYSENEVFCQALSVTRTEFFGAGRNGLNPERGFKVFAGDYAGERTCIYEGVRYAVYRTFKPENDDYIELYVQREGGTNGNGN